MNKKLEIRDFEECEGEYYRSGWMVECPYCGKGLMELSDYIDMMDIEILKNDINEKYRYLDNKWYVPRDAYTDPFHWKITIFAIVPEIDQI